MRFFNTAGQVDCHRHYSLQSLERFGHETALSTALSVWAEVSEEII
ncbi:MAG: hypothetical protein ACLFRE_08980 [Desulfovermiculus sp.]